MFWIIINREILEHLTSAKFALLTVLCLALVFLSAYVSTKDYELRQIEYQSTIQLLKEKGQPRDAWKAFRKPEVMGIFSQGLDKRLGNMVDVHSLSLKLTGYLGPYESRSGKHLSGFSAIDLTFVVRMILSLLAVFLAYDIISGEREAGTLKLTLSYFVKRSILLLGKFSGGIICLLIPLSMSFIIGLLVVQFSPLVELQVEEYLRVFLIFLISALYLTAFFALGMLVSCRTQNSATTLLILLILWICLLVIIPNASVVLVKKFKHIPSRAEIDKRFEAEGFRYTGDYEKDRKLSIMSEQELLNEMYSQTDMARWVSRISPGAIYSYATDTLARTDISAYHRFMRFVKDYSLRYEEFTSKAMKDPSLWQKFKEYTVFNSTPESLSDSVNAALSDICLLFLLNVLFFMGAYLSFLHYEV